MNKRILARIALVLSLSLALGSNPAQGQFVTSGTSQHDERQATYLYWVDKTNWKIQRGHLENGRIEDVFAGTESDQPLGLAIYPEGRKIYWTNGRGKIMRANLDGSGPEWVVDGMCGIGHLGDIALDAKNGKMYWGMYSDCLVTFMRANLDGSQRDFFLSGIHTPASIAVDSVYQKIYWTSADILRTNLNQPKTELLVDTNRFAPGIGIDYQTSKIFWIDFNWTAQKGTIFRADLSGSNPAAVLPGLDKPYGLAIDQEARKMYWGEPGKIRRANLDGTETEDVITGTFVPSEIEILFNKVSASNMEAAEEHPQEFITVQSYPNPFSGETNVSFSLDRPSEVTITVYDLLGRVVDLLATSYYPAGTHRVSWKPVGRPDGMYFCKIQTGTSTAVTKVILKQ